MDTKEVNQQYRRVRCGRIKYKPHPKKPGFLVSVSDIQSTRYGTLYEVQIDQEKGVFHVKNMTTQGIIYTSVPTESRVFMLRCIKGQLRKLGVVFKIETRQKRPDLTREARLAKKKEQPISNVGLGN